MRERENSIRITHQRKKKKRASRGRRASKEKGRKKEKIGCLAKKQHAFEKSLLTAPYYLSRDDLK